MSNQVNARKSKYDKNYIATVPPIKLSDAKRLKLHSESWGLLTDFYLESVKINRYRGQVYSAAIIKIGDRAGQTVCVLRGPVVGVLFGLTTQEWLDIEGMVENEQQLFYRYFKAGLHGNFSCEQKLFYNFCLTNQTSEVLLAFFTRCVNTRNKDKSDALLQINELRKCKHDELSYYIDYLQTNCDINT